MKDFIVHMRFAISFVLLAILAPCAIAAENKVAAPQPPALPTPPVVSGAPKVTPPGPPLRVLPRPAATVPSSAIVQQPAAGPQPITVRPPLVTPASSPNFIGPKLPPPATQPATVVTSNPSPQVPLPTNVMVFDADSKTVDVKPGEINAKFTFYFTNVSSSEVAINALRPSCGCTAAKLPEVPWKIAPGQSGPVTADMNVQGHNGVKTKGMTVETSAGNKFLTLMAIVPAPVAVVATNASTNGTVSMVRSDAERAKNLEAAMGDRQAPLKGDCAKCHVEPAMGKHGKELYVTACGICHSAERRATVVVDLQEKYPQGMPAEFWHMFVTMGKPGTLMPAFAKEHGGFLTPDQVTSLVQYLTKNFHKDERIIYRETSMEGGVPVPSTTSTNKELKTSSLLPGAFQVPGGGK